VAPEVVSGYGMVLPPIPTIDPAESLDPFKILKEERPFFIQGQIPRVPFAKYMEAINYMKLDVRWIHMRDLLWTD